MQYTIGEAARATGKSKATISKAIKEGKISAVRQGKTNTSPFAIDASELNRVFPLNTNSNTKLETVDNKETPKESSDNSALEVEVRLLREMLEFQKGIAERERQIAEDLRRQLDQTLKLLPAPEAGRGFLKRLFG